MVQTLVVVVEARVVVVVKMDAWIKVVVAEEIILVVTLGGIARMLTIIISRMAHVIILA